MIAKMFELRDRATFIPVLAVKLEPGNEQDRYLLGRAGYGITPDRQAEYVLMCGLDGGLGFCTIEPGRWTTLYNRTRFEAHKYIMQHFDRLESGAVIDVEYITGETDKPKKSRRRRHDRKR